MPNGFYACDTSFPREAPIAQRVALLHQLGYAGLGVKIDHARAHDEFSDLLKQLDAHGLSLISLGVVGDAATNTLTPSFTRAIPLIAGRGTLIELVLGSSSEHDRPSAPRADGRAIDLTRRVLDAAAPHGLRVALSPRTGSWLERIEHAVRLGMRINRPDLGLVFNMEDRLPTGDTDLEARLGLALPRLWAATIGDPTQSHHRDFLTALVRSGYTGPIGIRPGTDAGDPSSHLAAAITACRANMSRHA